MRPVYRLLFQIRFRLKQRDLDVIHDDETQNPQQRLEKNLLKICSMVSIAFASFVYTRSVHFRPNSNWVQHVDVPKISRLSEMQRVRQQRRKTSAAPFAKLAFWTSP